MTDIVTPDPVEDTIQRLAELHQAHHRGVAPVQRAANRITNMLGQPGAIVAILLLTVVWIAGNALAVRLGSKALEEFPFPDLALVATIAAVLIALLILTTQRHADELAEKRAQLTLQIAVLSEKKIAKVIELLEEQRRDNPLLANRHDGEAIEMARSSDPAESLARIEETHSTSQDASALPQ